MLTLILKFLFAAIFISLGYATYRLARKQIVRQSVPESVFERVVNWRMEIQEMDDFIEKCEQLDEWRTFIRQIPEQPRKGLRLVDKTPE